MEQLLMQFLANIFKHGTENVQTTPKNKQEKINPDSETIVSFLSFFFPFVHSFLSFLLPLSLPPSLPLFFPSFLPLLLFLLFLLSLFSLTLLPSFFLFDYQGFVIIALTKSLSTWFVFNFTYSSIIQKFKFWYKQEY